MDYILPNIKLLCGDSKDRLKEIESDSIDLTVTSPPYDNLRTYNGFTFSFEDIAKELYRVTKPGGVVVWVVADATIKGNETGTSFRQALYFKDVCGFNLLDTMVWRKPNPPPQIFGKRYSNSFEYMFVLTKGRINTFNVIEQSCKFAGSKSGIYTQKTPKGEIRIDRIEARRNRIVKETKPLFNVWDIPTHGQGASHPGQFPEQLARDHIISWSNPGETVLDPFMGSGTTGKQAVLNNRNFIGIEISQEYIDTIAKPRILNIGDFNGKNEEERHP